MTQTGAGNPVLTEIETALQVAENELPTLISTLSLFIPQLKALSPFLGLLPVAIQAVDTVNKAMGSTPQAAVAAVVNTLTPGQPGAPALN